jgi:hypothetical protein
VVARTGEQAVCPAGHGGPERAVQVLLGLTWLTDGALQLQPSMFGRGFVTGALLPNATGNPPLVARSIVAAAHFLEPHIAAWDALFAAVQLAIGLGLLARRSVRPALAVSFAWSLAVWWAGEGLGGLLTGTASPLTGAPGAVLLYVLVGLLAWPRQVSPGGTEGPSMERASMERASTERGSMERGSRLLGQAGARAIWVVLWVGSAALLLQPANLAGAALRDALQTAAAGQPGWYARLLSGAARVVGPSGTALTLALAVELAVVGIGGALAPRAPAILGLVVVLALAIWALPEGLGGILTGQGTDPNTGPLLALAAFAWYRAGPQEKALRTLSASTLSPAGEGARHFAKGAS